jgi:hypothetical protein
MKVVINKCYGGFSLSKAGMEFMGLGWDGYGFCSDIPRNDPKLVECVEQLGTDAGGKFAKLCIDEIPDNTQFSIQEYDGFEHVAEKHRTWG